MTSKSSSSTGGRFLSEEESKALVEQLQDADMVRFVLADMHGIGRTKFVPRHAVADSVRRGMTVLDCLCAFGPRLEIPAIRRFADTGYANARMVACPGTVQKVGWSKTSETHQIYQVLCEMQWDDHTMQEACPRYVTRKQVDRLQQQHGLRIKTGYELEFAVLDAKTWQPVSTTDIDYWSHVVGARFENMFLDLTQFLASAGVRGECYTVEFGAGQFEMPLVPGVGVRAADDVFNFKHVLKEYCQERGMLATFMSKPLENFGTIGAHLNHSLIDSTGRNVLYDAAGKDELSDTALYWLGGLVKHAPALTALCCPTVNCYHRSKTSVFVSKFASWGIENRIATVRVRNSTGGNTCFEFRMPSGASNPYISLAATIAAGLDGLNNKILPPEPANFDPKSAAVLPSTLSEALDVLERDKTLCEALGPEFIEWFVSAKRTHEVDVLENDSATFEMQQHKYLQFL